MRIRQVVIGTVMAGVLAACVPGGPGPNLPVVQDDESTGNASLPDPQDVPTPLVPNAPVRVTGSVGDTEEIFDLDVFRFTFPSGAWRIAVQCDNPFARDFTVGVYASTTPFAAALTQRSCAGLPAQAVLANPSADALIAIDPAPGVASTYSFRVTLVPA